jgi:hypothetical protein
MKNLILAFSVLGIVATQDFLTDAGPFVPSGGKSFYIDTDDYLTHGKTMFGSELRPVFVQLDFHTEYTMVTGFECTGCVVRGYNSTESRSRKEPVNKGTSLHYQRSRYENEDVRFGGYMV